MEQENFANINSEKEHGENKNILTETDITDVVTESLENKAINTVENEV